MGTISHKDDTNAMQPVSSPAVLLIGTIIDTSWRMFVPTIVCILSGVWLDSVFATKPFGLLVGTVLGFAIAGLLIHLQLQKGKA